MKSQIMVNTNADDFQNYSLYFINSYGQMVFSNLLLGAKTIVIESSNLARGLYLLFLINDKGNCVFTKKMLIN